MRSNGDLAASCQASEEFYISDNSSSEAIGTIVIRRNDGASAEPLEEYTLTKRPE